MGYSIGSVGLVRFYDISTIISIQFSINNLFALSLNVKQFYLTQSGLSGPGIDSSEGVLCIPQNSYITGASQSDSLMSYQEMQSVYSIAPSRLGWSFNAEAILVEHCKYYLGGARGVMVIVVGNGHGDTSSHPGRD